MSYESIDTPQDYVNYTFNVEARGIAEVGSELMGLSNTVGNILGLIAFKTSEFLTHTETAMIGFGAAVGAGFTAATRSAIDFQQQIANVQAIGGESINASQIGDAAMEYSNKFGMAVSSMTEGLEALARAGITSTSVMSQVLEEGVKLSKLEGLDLEDSMNDLISTTNLLASDNVDMNDASYAQMVKDMNQMIVSTSEASPIDAQNIIMTLQHAGGYAASSGIDQEDLFAVIAQLGAKGTKGEIAGTALRAFMSAGQKDTAQRALSRIGLNVSDLWDDNGETMLPISEMKNILDDAMKQRGYSKQEQLEFYSDFVGYKQANQVMKINTSEVEDYKESIANAWDLGKKLDVIMGTVKGNLNSIQQILTNFMTKVGDKLVTMLNVMVTPLKIALDLFTKIPFADTGVAAFAIFVSFKTLLTLFNKLVPAIATFASGHTKIEKDSINIKDDWKNIRNDMEKSAKIMGMIKKGDKKGLLKQHHDEHPLSAKARHEAELAITGQMYLLSIKDDKNRIDFSSLPQSVQEEMVVEYKIKHPKSFQKNFDEYVKRQQKFLDDMTESAEEITQYSGSSTVESINDYVKKIFELFNGNFSPSTRGSSNSLSGERNKPFDNREANILSRLFTHRVENNTYGNLEFKYRDEETSLEDLAKDYNKSVSQFKKQTNAFRNADVSKMTKAQTKVYSNLWRGVSSHGRDFAQQANQSEIRLIFNKGKIETHESKKHGVKTEQLKVMGNAIGYDISEEYDDEYIRNHRKKIAKKIHNKFQEQYGDKSLQERQNILDNILQNATNDRGESLSQIWESLSFNPATTPRKILTKNPEIAKELAERFNIENVSDDNITQAVLRHIAGMSDEDFENNKDFIAQTTFKHLKTHSGYSEVEQNNLKYMLENQERLKNTINYFKDNGSEFGFSDIIQEELDRMSSRIEQNRTILKEGGEKLGTDLVEGFVQIGLGIHSPGYMAKATKEEIDRVIDLFDLAGDEVESRARKLIESYHTLSKEIGTHDAKQIQNIMSKMNNIFSPEQYDDSNVTWLIYDSIKHLKKLKGNSRGIAPDVLKQYMGETYGESTAIEAQKWIEEASKHADIRLKNGKISTGKERTLQTIERWNTPRMIPSGEFDSVLLPDSGKIFKLPLHSEALDATIPEQKAKFKPGIMNRYLFKNTSHDARNFAGLVNIFDSDEFRNLSREDQNAVYETIVIKEGIDLNGEGIVKGDKKIGNASVINSCSGPGCPNRGEHGTCEFSQHCYAQPIHPNPLKNQIGRSVLFYTYTAEQISELLNQQGKHRIRINQEGDFRNIDDFEKALEIAQLNPDDIYYTYTKSLDVLKYVKDNDINRTTNMQVNNSLGTWADGTGGNYVAANWYEVADYLERGYKLCKGACEGCEQCWADLRDKTQEIIDKVTILRNGSEPVSVEQLLGLEPSQQISVLKELTANQHLEQEKLKIMAKELIEEARKESIPGQTKGHANRGIEIEEALKKLNSDAERSKYRKYATDVGVSPASDNKEQKQETNKVAESFNTRYYGEPHPSSQTKMLKSHLAQTKIQEDLEAYLAEHPRRFVKNTGHKSLGIKDDIFSMNSDNLDIEFDKYMRDRISRGQHIKVGSQAYTNGILGEAHDGQIIINPGVHKYTVDNAPEEYGNNYAKLLLETIVHEMTHILAGHEIRENQEYKTITGKGIEDFTTQESYHGYNSGFVAEMEANYAVIKLFERLGLESSKKSQERFASFKSLVDNKGFSDNYNLEFIDSIVDVFYENRRQLEETLSNMALKFDMGAAGVHESEIAEDVYQIKAALNNKTKSAIIPYAEASSITSMEDADELVSHMAIDLLSLNIEGTPSNYQNTMKQAVVQKYAPAVGLEDANIAYEYALEKMTTEVIDKFKAQMLEKISNFDFEEAKERNGDANSERYNVYTNSNKKEFMLELKQTEYQDSYLSSIPMEEGHAYDAYVHDEYKLIKDYIEAGIGGNRIHRRVIDNIEYTIAQLVKNLNNLFAKSLGTFNNQLLYHGGELNTNEDGFGIFNMRSLSYNKDVAKEFSEEPDRWLQEVFVPEATSVITPSSKIIKSWVGDESELTTGINQPYLELDRDEQERTATVILLGPNEQNQFLQTAGLKPFNRGGHQSRGIEDNFDEYTINQMIYGALQSFVLENSRKRTVSFKALNDRIKKLYDEDLPVDSWLQEHYIRALKSTKKGYKIDLKTMIAAIDSNFDSGVSRFDVGLTTPNNALELANKMPEIEKNILLILDKYTDTRNDTTLKDFLQRKGDVFGVKIPYNLMFLLKKEKRMDFDDRTKEFKYDYSISEDINSLSKNFNPQNMLNYDSKFPYYRIPTTENMSLRLLQFMTYGHVLRSNDKGMGWANGREIGIKPSAIDSMNELFDTFIHELMHTLLAHGYRTTRSATLWGRPSVQTGEIRPVVPESLEIPYFTGKKISNYPNSYIEELGANRGTTEVFKKIGLPLSSLSEDRVPLFYEYIKERGYENYIQWDLLDSAIDAVFQNINMILDQVGEIVKQIFPKDAMKDWEEYRDFAETQIINSQSQRPKEIEALKAQMEKENARNYYEGLKYAAQRRKQLKELREKQKQAYKDERLVQETFIKAQRDLLNIPILISEEKDKKSAKTQFTDSQEALFTMAQGIAPEKGFWGELRNTILKAYGAEVNNFTEESPDRIKKARTLIKGKDFSLLDKSTTLPGEERFKFVKKIGDKLRAKHHIPGVDDLEEKTNNTKENILSKITNFGEKIYQQSQDGVLKESGDWIGEKAEGLEEFRDVLGGLSEILPVLTPAVMFLNKTLGIMTIASQTLAAMEAFRTLTIDKETAMENLNAMSKKGNSAATMLHTIATWKDSKSIIKKTAAQLVENGVNLVSIAIKKVKIAIEWLGVTGMLLIVAAIAAVIAAIKLVQFWENKHADSLKEKQKILQETTATNKAALSQYKDLKKSREAETDSIKKQQKARKEAIALNKLQIARTEKQKAIKDENDTRNHGIWGEYGYRASLQKMGWGESILAAGVPFLGTIFKAMAGDFESQYDQYDGTTKNIRQIKENSLTWGASSAQKQVGQIYSDHSLFFAMVEGNKDELQTLYDIESKLIEKYGSLDVARGTKEFEEAVQEFADATGIQGETAVKMLDWLETENQVDQATQVMQTEVDLIVSRADAEALAAEYGSDDLSTEGLRDTMIYAQADQIYKDAYDKMWWNWFGNTLFAILYTMANYMTLGLMYGEEKDRYNKKAEAYQNGLTKLTKLGVDGLYEIGENTDDSAERRNYGTYSYTITNDTPFGGAKEAAAMEYADEKQKSQYQNTGQVMTEKDYVATQNEYQEKNFNQTSHEANQEKIQQEKEAQEEQVTEETTIYNNNEETTYHDVTTSPYEEEDTLAQLQNNGKEAHKDAQDIIKAILNNAGAISGAGAGAYAASKGASSADDIAKAVTKKATKKAAKETFDYMENGEDSKIGKGKKYIEEKYPKVKAKAAKTWKNIKETYSQEGWRGLYDKGKTKVKSAGNQAIDALESKGIDVRPYAEEGLSTFRKGKSTVKSTASSIHGKVKDFLYGKEVTGERYKINLDGSKPTPITSREGGLIPKTKDAFSNIKAGYKENGWRGAYDATKSSIKSVGAAGKSKIQGTKAYGRVKDFLYGKEVTGERYKINLDGSKPTPITSREGGLIPKVKGAFSDIKAAHAEKGWRGVYDVGKSGAKQLATAGKSGLSRVASAGKSGLNKIIGSGSATKQIVANGAIHEVPIASLPGETKGLKGLYESGRAGAKSLFNKGSNKVTQRIAVAREANLWAKGGVDLPRNGIDRAVGAYDGAKAAYAEGGPKGLAKAAASKTTSGVKGFASTVSNDVGGAKGLAKSAGSEMKSLLSPKAFANDMKGVSKGLKGGGGLTKSLGKVGGRALAMLGPALTFADKASELNPFEGKHYNEDGTEKKALQATGEVVGSTVGALGGVAGGAVGADVGMAAGAAIGSFLLPGVGTVIGGAIGSVAGGMVGGWLGDTIFTPIGDAIGGTVGWLGDNLLGGIQGVAGTVWDGLTGAAGGVWNAVSGAAGGVWNWLTGGGEENENGENGGAPIKGALGLTPIGMAINGGTALAQGIGGALGLTGNEDTYKNVNLNSDENKKNNEKLKDGSTIVIENVNINTEDDPEKIKSAFMNLMIELQEQVNPRQVSRVVGEAPTTTSTTETTDENNQDAAEGTDSTSENSETESSDSNSSGTSI